MTPSMISQFTNRAQFQMRLFLKYEFMLIWILLFKMKLVFLVFGGKSLLNDNLFNFITLIIRSIMWVFIHVFKILYLYDNEHCLSHIY